MIYYSKIWDAPLYDLLIQDIIYNDNQLMVFYYYIRKECTYTGIRTGAYIVFYQVVPIDHFTHILGPVAQPSIESEYNVECNTGTATEHFRILNNEFMNKDTYVVP